MLRAYCALACNSLRFVAEDTTVSSCKLTEIGSLSVPNIRNASRHALTWQLGGHFLSCDLRCQACNLRPRYRRQIKWHAKTITAEATGDEMGESSETTSSTSSTTTTNGSSPSTTAPAQASGGFQILTSLKTEYNHIMILQVPEFPRHCLAGARVLLLDFSGNVHSAYFTDRRLWTESYWDEFACLPPIIPEGPIGILGLGGGTAPRLLRRLFPDVRMEGWEIDGILIDKAREYLGMGELEVATPEGGVLTAHVGDAFSDNATVLGGFAGLIVDLFADGAVLPQLSKPETWASFKSRLRPGGRIMVNCGGVIDKSSSATSTETASEDESTWERIGKQTDVDSVIRALKKVFPGEVHRRVAFDAGNIMALTGPDPDREAWALALPAKFKGAAATWEAA